MTINYDEWKVLVSDGRGYAVKCKKCGFTDWVMTDHSCKTKEVIRVF